MDKKGLTATEKDALKKLVTIGADHAAAALSMMINKRVAMNVPKVYILSLGEFINRFDKPDEEVTAVYIRMRSGVQGAMAFILRKSDAIELVSLIVQREIDATDLFNDFNKSVLLETGNIITGAYLTALSSLLHIEIIPNVPSICNDMMGAIVSEIITEIQSESEEDALILETEFQVAGGVKSRGYFFFFPAGESIQKLINALGLEK